MADNVAITAGSGTNIAADDISSVMYQRVKVSLGADGSATDLLGDSTRGAYVNLIGQTTRIQVTPTISSSPAYTSGDALGGLMTFASATRVSGAGGTINGITVLDKTQAQRSAMDLFLFSASVTVAVDNAAATFSDSDMLNCVGIIALGSWNYNTAFAGTPTNSIAVSPPIASAATSVQTLAIPYVCAGGTSLYGQLVVRGTPTYTSTSDIVVSLYITPD